MADCYSDTLLVLRDPETVELVYLLLVLVLLDYLEYNQWLQPEVTDTRGGSMKCVAIISYMFPFALHAGFIISNVMAVLKYLLISYWLP